MPDSLTVALVGAGGAVLGSGTTVVPTVWLERRRARRERAEADLRARDELHEAARLVGEELREARKLLEHAVERRRFWPVGRAVPTATWNQYRRVLAVRLGAADWATLAIAYDELNEVNWLAGEDHAATAAGAVSTEPAVVDAAEKLRQPWWAVEAALHLLEDAAGIPERVEVYLRRTQERAAQLWP